MMTRTKTSDALAAKLAAFLVLVVSLAGCEQLSYAPKAAAIKFTGLRSLVQAKDGSYIISWETPDATSAPIDGYEIYVQDMQGLSSTGLALDDSTPTDAASVNGVMVDIPDSTSPVTLGKVYGIVKDDNTYTVSGLLPGNYGIQVKALGTDGTRDANMRVALLTVSTKIQFAGLATAELSGKEVVLKWPAFVSTLKGDPIYYIVFEGETFAEDTRLAIVSAGADGVVPTEYRLSIDDKLPGTLLSYGVRVKDPLGVIDQNVVVRHVQIPDDETPYEGCIEGKALGSSKVELQFEFPPKAEQVNIYRNGAKVYEVKSGEHPIFTDIGLQEGETYVYTCEAIRYGVAKVGSHAVSIETLNSNPPTFAGVTNVTIESQLSATASWGVATGVPANYFAVFATPGHAVDWGGGSLTTVDAAKLSTILGGFGDELPYAFGVRACTSSNICDGNTVTLNATIPDAGPPKTVGATNAEVKNGKFVITAPWKPEDGAIVKRRVYVYIGTSGAGDFANYILKKTVVVDDILAPQTALELGDLIENANYNIIVRDEDPSGNVSTNLNKVTRTSGDLNAPVFAGLSALRLGPDGRKETTLTASFVAIAKESADPAGASHYQIYLKVGGGNACENGVFQSEFSTGPYDAGLSYDYVITGLAARTMYGVCLKARDSAGNISSGDNFLAKSTIDTTPPNFDGLQSNVYLVDEGVLKLDWNASASADTLEYVVKVWKNVAIPQPSDILSLSKAHPTFKTGFKLDKTQFVYGSNDTVYVLVQACDNAGFIPNGQQNCTNFPITSALKVTLADIDPPTGFAGIAAINAQTATVEGTIGVAWIAPVDWSDYRGFKIYSVDPGTQALTSLKSCACSALGCPEQPTSCEITGLDPYRTYILHVRAYDNENNLTILDPLVKSVAVRAADTTAPTFSSNLSIAFTAGATDLAWNPATDNQYAAEPGAQITYKVWRKTTTGFGNALNPGADGELMATQTSAVYRDNKDYESGKRYYYTICAIDASANTRCDGNVKNVLTPDLVAPEIASFTTDKTPDGKGWALAWTVSDNKDTGAELFVTVRSTISPTAPETPTLAAVPLDSGFGRTGLSSLVGPQNQDVYVNYLLTVEDTAGNVATATLSVYSQNRIVITSVKENEGPTSGGNIIVLNGTGFHTSTTVKIGNASCLDVQFIGKEMVICEAPGGTIGTKHVTATNVDGSLGELLSSYTYCAAGSCSNVCGNPGTWGPNFAAGNGSAGQPYLICTPQHLSNLRTYGDFKYAELADNIDLGDYTNNDFPPISTNPNGWAYVIFDGKGHVVANWSYTAPPAVNQVGLFTGLISGYYAKNVGVVNVNVRGASNVGALAGYSDSTAATFSNVFATGTITGTGDNVGGILGYANTNIVGAYANVNVTGVRAVGGIAGQKHQIAANIHASGLIISTGINDNYGQAGGLFGYWNAPSQVLDGAYFIGEVRSQALRNHHTGGLVGDLNNVTLKNVYMIGKVTGARYVGGIAGQCNNVIIEDSKVVVDVKGTDYYVGGLCGNLGGRVTNSSTSGKVVGVNQTGGLVGNTSAQIETSSSTVAVTGGSEVGGLVGAMSSGKILDSFAKGSVTATGVSGGLVGRLHASTMQRSYANGNVLSSGDYVGGLIGQENYGNIVDVTYATGKVTGQNYVGGLFGYCRPYTTGKISNSYASGKTTGVTGVGGFCGLYYGDNVPAGTEPLTDSYSTGAVVATGDQVGGFIGDMQSYGPNRLKIIRSNSTGSVKGRNEVGGFVGRAYYQYFELSQDFARGDVTGESTVGGFIGQNNWGYYSEIKDCHARGNVIGSNYMGGFAGYSVDGIRRSFSTGSVTQAIEGVGARGGFAGGVRTDATHGFAGMPNTYFDKDTAGLATSPAGVGKTTAEMKQQGTFVNFNFIDNWRMPTDGSYPMLKWQP